MENWFLSGHHDPGGIHNYAPQHAAQFNGVFRHPSQHEISDIRSSGHPLVGHQNFPSSMPAPQSPISAHQSHHEQLAARTPARRLSDVHPNYPQGFMYQRPSSQTPPSPHNQDWVNTAQRSPQLSPAGVSGIPLSANSHPSLSSPQSSQPSATRPVPALIHYTQHTSNNYPPKSVKNFTQDPQFTQTPQQPNPHFVQPQRQPSPQIPHSKLPLNNYPQNPYLSGLPTYGQTAPSQPTPSNIQKNGLQNHAISPADPGQQDFINKYLGSFSPSTTSPMTPMTYQQLLDARNSQAHLPISHSQLHSMNRPSFSTSNSLPPSSVVATAHQSSNRHLYPNCQDIKPTVVSTPNVNNNSLGSWHQSITKINQSPTPVQNHSQPVAKNISQSSHRNPPIQPRNPSSVPNQDPLTTQHRSPSTNQHRTPSTNQQRTPSTNQHRTPSTNQHRTPSTNQQRTPSTNQQRTPSTNQHATPSANQHRTPTTNQHRTPTTNQHRTPSTVHHPGPSTIQHRNSSTSLERDSSLSHKSSHTLDRNLYKTSEQNLSRVDPNMSHAQFAYPLSKPNQLSRGRGRSRGGIMRSRGTSRPSSNVDRNNSTPERSENVTPMQWYRRPDANHPSPYQSDMEAMRGSITTGTPPTSVSKSVPQNLSNKTQSNVSKADSLAAIQIKQEMMENVCKSKVDNTSTVPETRNTSSNIEKIPENTVPSQSLINHQLPSTNHSSTDRNTSHMNSVQNNASNPDNQSRPSASNQMIHPSVIKQEKHENDNSSSKFCSQSTSKSQHMETSHGDANSNPNSRISSMNANTNLYSSQLPASSSNFRSIESLSISSNAPQMYSHDQSRTHPQIDSNPSISNLANRNSTSSTTTSFNGLLDARPSTCASLIPAHNTPVVDVKPTLNARDKVYSMWQAGQVVGRSPVRGRGRGRGRPESRSSLDKLRGAASLQNSFVQSKYPSPEVLKRRNNSGKENENLSSVTPKISRSLPVPEREFQNRTTDTHLVNDFQSSRNMMIGSNGSNLHSSKKPYFYATLHGHKLLCINCSDRPFVLICQFVFQCFENFGVGEVMNCIDRALRIKKRTLDHPEKSKIVSYLKNNGYLKGHGSENYIDTISVDDARRVYHNMNSMQDCSSVNCVMELTSAPVDFSAVLPLTRANIVRIKKEKTDDSFFGKIQPKKGLNQSNINSKQNEISKSSSEKKADSENESDHTEEYGDNDNALSDSETGHLSTSRENLIVLDSENTHPIAGLINTVVGQVRSYQHKGENYLVVDDVSRILGTEDFFNIVKLEKITLYSCDEKIRSVLNDIDLLFPPLASSENCLVKEIDIGTETSNDTHPPELDGMTNATSKRKFKKEIEDDDGSSPNKRARTSPDTSQIDESLFQSNCDNMLKENSTSTSRCRADSITDESNHLTNVLSREPPYEEESSGERRLEMDLSVDTEDNSKSVENSISHSPRSQSFDVHDSRSELNKSSENHPLTEYESSLQETFLFDKDLSSSELIKTKSSHLNFSSANNGCSLTESNQDISDKSSNPNCTSIIQQHESEKNNQSKHMSSSLSKGKDSLLVGVSNQLNTMLDQFLTSPIDTSSASESSYKAKSVPDNFLSPWQVSAQDSAVSKQSDASQQNNFLQPSSSLSSCQQRNKLTSSSMDKAILLTDGFRVNIVPKKEPIDTTDTTREHSPKSTLMFRASRDLKQSQDDIDVGQSALYTGECTLLYYSFFILKIMKQGDHGDALEITTFLNIYEAIR